MVIWTLPAKNDLKKIYNYIAEDSEHYANKVSQEFIEKSELLMNFPKMGRVVQEIGNPNIRELFIYSYRLIYEISSAQIDVLAIVHCKQNFTGDFEEIRK